MPTGDDGAPILLKEGLVWLWKHSTVRVPKTLLLAGDPRTPFGGLIPVPVILLLVVAPGSERKSVTHPRWRTRWRANVFVSSNLQ